MKNGNRRTIATRVLMALAPVLSMALSLLAPGAGHAAVITVCVSGCDSTTIQGGVDAAIGGDTIRLLDTSYTEANIQINVSVVLEGIIGNNTTIQAQGGTSFENGGVPGRVLDVVGGNTEVLVRDLRIRYGRIDSNGGGIFSFGILTLERVTVQSNEGWGGGGIYSSGTLVVRNSVVSGNTATNFGGGISNGGDGLLVSINSSFSGNQADNLGGNLYSTGTASLRGCLMQDGQAFFGGGIYSTGFLEFSGLLTLNEASSRGAGIYQAGGTIELLRAALYNNDTAGPGGGWYINSGAAIVTDSTLSGNTSRSGGAIYQTSATSLRVRNSTLSFNTATQDGGAIFIAENRGVEISSSTIVNNRADRDDTNNGDGGGLFLEPCSGGFCSPGRAYLRNSILANNIDQTTSGSQAHDCDGELNLQGYNLVEDAGTVVTFVCRAVDDLTGAQLGVDPALGGLTLNGGTPLHPGGSPPLVHFLLGGSPAINTGNPSGCLDENGSALGADQRGASRVGRCDLGAFEANGAPQEVIFADAFSTGTTLTWSAATP